MAAEKYLGKLPPEHDIREELGEKLREAAALKDLLRVSKKLGKRSKKQRETRDLQDLLSYAVESLKSARRLVSHLLESSDQILPHEELQQWMVFPQVLEQAGVLEKHADGWRLTSVEAAQEWLAATEIPPEWRELGDGNE